MQLLRFFKLSLAGGRITDIDFRYHKEAPNSIPWKISGLIKVAKGFGIWRYENFLSNQRRMQTLR